MANSDIANADAAAAKAMGKKNFKGYTMEELRYQRALAALRKEFCKSKVTQSVKELRKPFGDSKAAKALPAFGNIVSKVPALTTAGGLGKTVLKTVTGRLKPWDYVVLGISLVPPAVRMFRKFRKKKNKDQK